MTIRFSTRAGLVCLVTAAALMAGCSSKGSKADRPDNPFRADSARPGDPRAPLSERELRLEADQAYRRSHESLVSADYETAITRFTQLISRYPFSDYATQAELEKIFAQYRSFQADEAGLGADRFLREHPRHPNADYVQYIKGLTDSNRDNGLVDYLPLDGSKRDATNSRRAYDDFALLLQRFPNSRYAGDARKRMIYLRNRIAAHELSVTRYYIKRGAWVAAAKRGESIIAEYPGAPATAETLVLLRECYDRLGEKAQLAEIDQLIAVNSASLQAAKTPAPRAEPRAVATTAGSPDATAATVATQTPTPPPQGFFGRAAALLDTLNKTYTLPSTEPAGTTSTAAAPAHGEPAHGEPDYATPASLSTGPYSGPDSSIRIPTARDNRTPVEAEGNPQPPPAPGTEASKKKGGFLDFLNKTYTIGGSSKGSATATTPAAPAAVPDAQPPAAIVPTAPATVVPVPAAPSSAPVSSAPAVAAPPAAAASATATTAPAAPKEKSGGFLDFLNKTYTIGGKKKPPEAAPTPPPDSTPSGASINGSGVHFSIEDYEGEDAAKKKAAEDAAKAATAPAEAPATEPAK